MKTLFPLLLTALLLRGAAAAQEAVVVPDSQVKVSPTVIAVMDFERNGADSVLVRSVTNLIGSELAGEKAYRLVERSQVREVLAEQGFQQTGCTETSCAVEIGKLISADKILIGSIDRMGDGRVINAKIVDVRTGVLEHAENVKVDDEDELYGQIKVLCNRLKASLGVKVEGASLKNGPRFVPVDLWDHIAGEIGKGLSETFDTPRPSPGPSAPEAKAGMGVHARSWVAFGISFIPVCSGKYLTRDKESAFRRSLVDLLFVSGSIVGGALGGTGGDILAGVSGSLLGLYSTYDAFTSREAVLKENRAYSQSGAVPAMVVLRF